MFVIKDRKVAGTSSLHIPGTLRDLARIKTIRQSIKAHGMNELPIDAKDENTVKILKPIAVFRWTQRPPSL